MPLTLTAYVGSVAIAFFICALAVAGGVGGGALYMPIYVFLTGDAHIAVPLAKITTNGVGWSAFLFNVFNRHPHGGPMIDYDVALMMEPLTLLGTAAGVVMNVCMTTAEVLFTLVVVLSVTAWKTFQKGFEQKAKEDAAFEGEVKTEARDKLVLEKFVEPSPRDDQNPLVNIQHLPAYQTALELGSNEDCEDAQDFLKKERRQYPWEKIGMITLLWGAHAATMVTIGGPKALLCGGWHPLVAFGINVAIQVMATLTWRDLMLKKQAKRDALGLPSSSYSFDQSSTLIYPLFSFVAGICAGALGIAGGLVKGPLMLNWGLLPQSAAATAIFMILFTSSSTILQFVQLGRLELVPALVFWLTGFVGGLAGSKVFAEIMKRTGRQSYLALFLGLLIVLSGVSMSGLSVLQMVGVVKAETRGLGALCTR